MYQKERPRDQMPDRFSVVLCHRATPTFRSIRTCVTFGLIACANSYNCAAGKILWNQTAARQEHSGWWKATVGDAVYWVGEADAEDFDVLFSPIGDFNSAEQLADNVVKTPDEAKAIAERHHAANP